MVFFILSKNLDQILLQKMKDKKLNNRSKAGKSSKGRTHKKQKSLNISTPQGKLTMENAFSKPHIVINNFMINQKQGK